VNRKVIIVTLTFEVLLIVMLFGFIRSRSATLNVSALLATGNVGVYWDANATKRVNSVGWGVLVPNQTAKSVVYVRNEANVSTVLVLSTANWNPAGASKYLIFSWNAQNRTLDPGDVVMVNQYLSVSSSAKGISDFSFDIVFEGRGSYPGDINQDGAVDLGDTVVIALAYNSTPSSPNWNPNADINKDGLVDILDLVFIARDFGKS
jgi:hypothetical protein